VRTHSSIKVCTHIILGLPGETIDQMHETIDRMTQLPMEGIKVHLLHVIKNTALHKEYLNGEFQVFEEDAYVSLICDLLEKLPPAMIIHRLTGEAVDHKMVAPRWGLNKGTVLNKIDQELDRRGTTQGSKYRQKSDTLDVCSSK